MKRARLLAGLGLFLLLLVLFLRYRYAEFPRLMVGGLIAPAPLVILWFTMASGALLGLAPVVGKWSGTWRHATFAISLVVMLAGLASLGARLLGPVTSTVHYRSGDIAIAGTLRLPRGPGPFPAAIIAHGSAPFRRGFYSEWADSLVNRGIAVLVTDKRGVGASGGVLETRNNAARSYLELLASDIVAGVRYLQGRSEIDHRKVGVVGISQGGWVGPLAAAQDSSIAFLVLLSGPATSTGEENTWSKLRGDHDGPALMSLTAANDSLVRTPPRGFDPRPVIAGLRTPSLWMFGEADNSVPTAKSVVALDSLAQAGAPVQSHVVPGADHVMMRHDGPFGLVYTDPRAWAVWLGWIQQTTNR